MLPHRWPITGKDCPQDIAKHANCLKTDFDLVSKTATIGLSRSATLPSNLGLLISTGIEKGIAEARSNGYCPEWSKVDETVFRDVMLKHIASEAAPKTRDRIPLDQFNGLRRSYNALQTKLVAQLSSNATSHQSVGAHAPITAASVGAPVEPSRVTNTAPNPVRPSGKSVTNSQEKRSKDVTVTKKEGREKEIREKEAKEKEAKEKAAKEKDSREKEGREKAAKEKESRENKAREKESREKEAKEKEGREKEAKGKESKGQDVKDGQAVSGIEDSESDNSSSEDSSTSSSSVAEDESALHYSKEAQNLKIINHNHGTHFSATFNIRIEHQANVILLAGISPQPLRRRVDLSLRAFLRKQTPSWPNLTGVSGAELQDNGDVKIDIESPTCSALRLFVELAGWDKEFERTLVATPAPKFWLTMQNVKVSSFRFQNRKEKAARIKQLEDANHAIHKRSWDDPIIGDIAWIDGSSKKVMASLVVGFRDLKQANRALANGLNWQGTRHRCERVEKKGKLIRCSRCQSYDHQVVQCTAAYRCGKCAGSHNTRTCKSEIVKCASCGSGGHYAGSTDCPEKIKARKKCEFKNEKTSQSIRSAAESDRMPPSDVHRSTSAGRTQTEASMPSPVSLGAASSEDEVKSGSKPSLPKTQTAKHHVESQSKQPLPEAKTAENDVVSQSEQPLPQVESAEDNVGSQFKQPLPQVETAERYIDLESEEPLPQAETAKENVEPKSKQPLSEVKTAEEYVESQSKQSLPQADSAQHTTAELATIWQDFEDFKKKFAALHTILQSQVSSGTKRQADEAFVSGEGAEASSITPKRIKKEEPAREDSMGLYRQPSVYSEDRS